MSRDFEELDYRETPLGELVLRRRRMHSLGGNGRRDSGILESENFPPLAMTAWVTHSGLAACVMILSITFLPAAAARATSESRKAKLNWPSTGSSADQS